MQNQVSVQHFLKGRAESRNKLRWQIRDKAHGVGQNNLWTVFNFQPTHRGVKRCKKHVFSKYIRTGYPIEKRRFPRVCVADQSNNRERYFCTCRTVKCAGFDHFFKLFTQAAHLIINGTAVRFDLCLAGTTNKAQTTPLALKVGPSADQTGTLIGQMRHLNLQNTLTSARPVAENLKDKTRAIKQFHAPCFFEVTLLNGRNGTVDQDQLNVIVFEHDAQFFDFTFTKKHARMNFGKRDNCPAFHIKVRQSFAQSNCFSQSIIRLAPIAFAFYVRMDHPRPSVGRFGLEMFSAHVRLALRLFTVIKADWCGRHNR